MKTRMLIVAMLSSFNLAACSEPPPAPEAAAPPATAKSAAPTEITKENQGVLTDTQREGYNEANQVSEQLKAAEEARRKQMEAQGI